MILIVTPEGELVLGRRDQISHKNSNRFHTFDINTFKFKSYLLIKLPNVKVLYGNSWIPTFFVLIISSKFLKVIVVIRCFMHLEWFSLFIYLFF